MTQIIKKYWIWDESLNHTDYKLGHDIKSLIEKKSIVENVDSSNEYHGINGYPWLVKTHSMRIESVTFRDDKFFSFCQDGLWDMESNDLIKNVNKLLAPCDNYYKGDILYVVFRGGFIATAKIYRNFIK